jgi:hypothetical protein
MLHILNHHGNPMLNSKWLSNSPFWRSRISLKQSHLIEEIKTNQATFNGS